LSVVFSAALLRGFVYVYFLKNILSLTFPDFHCPQTMTPTQTFFLRFLKNLLRNLKATGIYFLIGIILSALFQRYVPADITAALFGKENRGFGLLMAATIGVPLYMCGGGTIPLLQQWLTSGMTMGSAAAFMITGPATKITNLGAIKIVLGLKDFIFHLAFTILFALLSGFFVDYVFGL
jgi:uncharacterized membrane protein YraQ (UPF0718 family)